MELTQIVNAIEAITLADVFGAMGLVAASVWGFRRVMGLLGR